MPYGFACVGWALGVVLLILCAVSSGFALYFLTICGQLTKIPTSFHQVAEMSVPRYAWLVDASVAIKCYGAGLSYLIIVADLMPVVMHSVKAPVGLQSRYFWVVLSFALVTPLVCFERLDSLKYTSALSIAFVLMLLTIVTLYGTHAAGFDPCVDTDDGYCFGPTDVAVPSPWLALKALPIFVFGYTCQQVINHTEFIYNSHAIYILTLTLAIHKYIPLEYFCDGERDAGSDAAQVQRCYRAVDRDRTGGVCRGRFFRLPHVRPIQRARPAHKLSRYRKMVDSYLTIQSSH